ncbi:MULTISPECIES: hypothetical protein [Blautia]|uniref:hypothetical protein n=1 Tax=Blautia TaxID=572511 RepID=UPI000BA4D29F|nr:MULTISPECIES: hypothetical protein [Blautia]
MSWQQNNSSNPFGNQNPFSDSSFDDTKSNPFGGEGSPSFGGSPSPFGDDSSPFGEEFLKTHGEQGREDTYKKSSELFGRQRIKVKTKSSANYAVGIIQNLQERPVRDSAWIRFTRSLAHGISYGKYDTRYSFNVISHDVMNSADSMYARSDAVNVYGEIRGGDLYNGQNVEVWGSRSHGVLIATKIVCTSTGVQTKMQAGIPGVVIRAVTLIVLLFLFSLIKRNVGLLNGFSPGQFIHGILGKVMPVILIAGCIVVLVAGRSICRTFHISYGVLYMFLIVAACIFIPSIGSIFITIAAIVYLLKILVK